MRGSLVILAALCVVVAAEASSVRFVSVDEGQNGSGKDKKDRNGVGEGPVSDLKKSVDDVVKKINDGAEKKANNMEVDRSSASEKSSGSDGEGAKKSATPQKPKIQKRDVKRALNLLSKRGMKRASDDELGTGWNLDNARQIITNLLSIQKNVVSKIATTLIIAVEHIETDEKEKEVLVGVLKTFRTDVEQVYDNAINGLGKLNVLPEIPPSVRKFVRADEVPAIITAMNQRNPLAIIPLLARLIGAAAGAADIANSFGARSNVRDAAPVFEMIERLLSTANVLPVESSPPDY